MGSSPSDGQVTRLLRNWSASDRSAFHHLVPAVYAELDQQQAKIVELRFCVGLAIEETAEALHISTATVKRDWLAAKMWIQRRLTKPTSYPAKRS